MRTLTASPNSLPLPPPQPKARQPYLIMIIILMIIGSVLWWGVSESLKPNFTIGGHGDSLLRHDLGYQRSIAVANKVGLPIYKKEIGGRKTLISYEEARKLENATDQTRISVPVYPGDQFNLRFGTQFRPGPGAPAARKR